MKVEINITEQEIKEYIKETYNIKEKHLKVADIVMSGNDLIELSQYLVKKLTIPVVIGQGEQLMQSCSVCGNHKHPVLGAHCKASNCPNEH
jgi:hypothetical protein